jgi:hypothetical protein
MSSVFYGSGILHDHPLIDAQWEVLAITGAGRLLAFKTEVLLLANRGCSGYETGKRSIL